MTSDGGRYRPVADAAWRWVLDQVRTDDTGPWIPETVDVDANPDADPHPDAPQEPTPGPYRDSMYEGVGGLAHALAEIRLARPWTDEDTELASAVAQRLRDQVASTEEVTYFDGLASTVGALLALGEPGAEAAVARAAALLTPDGWPATDLPEDRYRPGARLNDATVGTAGVLLAAVWADRRGVPDANAVAARIADVLLAESDTVPTGLDWAFVPARFELNPRPRMPNWSHGLAGIAGALAVAGLQLDRPELVDAARRGAEHLVTLGNRSGGGFVVPISLPLPAPEAADPISYGWCHGPTGTAGLFLALDRAGVTEVAGEPTTVWADRGHHSIRTSGLPARLRPGFWDNDGRCCGTAGVGDAVLDRYARTGDPADLAFSATWATPSSSAPSRRTATRTGASWSTADPSRCCCPGSGGCKVPQGSRPTCSGWPGCSATVRTPPRWPAPRTGGRSVRREAGTSSQMRPILLAS